MQSENSLTLSLSLAVAKLASEYGLVTIIRQLAQYARIQAQTCEKPSDRDCWLDYAEGLETLLEGQ